MLGSAGVVTGTVQVMSQINMHKRNWLKAWEIRSFDDIFIQKSPAHPHNSMTYNTRTESQGKTKTSRAEFYREANVLCMPLFITSLSL